MRPFQNATRRAAFTLVEILVTTMVMLIMVLAISQIFVFMGRHVSDGRALIELQGQLRNAAFRVQEDLDGITILARSPPRLDWEVGYFEYIEGFPPAIGSDVDPQFVAPGTGIASVPRSDGTQTAYGDIDDVLMFTARSTGRPFIGRVSSGLTPSGTSRVESQDAEIIYWTTWDPTFDGDSEIDLGEMVLRRRILLIRPDVSAFDTGRTSLTPSQLATFLDQNDISIRIEYRNGTIWLVPNSLADLAKRENRFGHWPIPVTIPPMSPPNVPRPFVANFPNGLERSWLPDRGDDVLLSDLLAFDVRAYDPQARLYLAGATSGDLLGPGDLGWSAATNLVGRGAYVDVGYNASGRTSNFSGNPNAKSGLHSPLSPTYDTWTWFYEHDGVNQNNGVYVSSGTADEATNGIDDDGFNGVDDAGERETSPPYPVPLTGIKITLRVIELDTRQVRQTSVVSKFTPE